MKNKNVKEKKKEKKLGLTTKIFIALILGAVFGIVLCYLIPDSKIKHDIIVEGVLYVIGQGFIRLMKMLVVPLVFCSLVCGRMAIGDTKKLGAVQIVEHAASGKGQKQAAQDRCDLRAVVIQPFQKRRAAVRLLRLLMRIAVQRLIIRGKRAV